MQRRKKVGKKKGAKSVKRFCQSGMVSRRYWTALCLRLTVDVRRSQGKLVVYKILSL
jgi:hypothetical protein